MKTPWLDYITKTPSFLIKNIQQKPSPVQYYSIRRGYRKEMNLLKISRFLDFIQNFPDFSQRFPDFSLTKFFNVRKCERCGSLNPRLSMLNIVQLRRHETRKNIVFFYFICLLYTSPSPRDS